jgi:hypothetical protein
VNGDGGKLCQRLAEDILKNHHDEPMIVTVTITRNVSPNVGKTAVGIAATFHLTGPTVRQVFNWAIESIEDEVY